jgi:hypothetical protein
MRIVTAGALGVAAVTLDYNLGYTNRILAPQWAPYHFLMAVSTQNPHILRIAHQVTVRRIGWVCPRFAIGEGSHLIFNGKRHSLFGRMVTRRTVVANFTIDTRLNDHTHHSAILVGFLVNAGRPLGIDFLMARLAGRRALVLRKFGSDLRYRGTAVMAVLVKRILSEESSCGYSNDRNNRNQRQQTNYVLRHNLPFFVFDLVFNLNFNCPSFDKPSFDET